MHFVATSNRVFQDRSSLLQYSFSALLKSLGQTLKVRVPWNSCFRHPLLVVSYKRLTKGRVRGTPGPPPPLFPNLATPLGHTHTREYLLSWGCWVERSIKGNSAKLGKCRCKIEKIMNGKATPCVVTRVLALPCYLLPTQPTHMPYAAMVPKRFIKR